MKKMRNSVLNLVLSFLLLVSVVPSAMKTIEAEHRSIKLYFDASNHLEETLGLWAWGDSIPEDLRPSEWMVNDYRFKRVENSNYVQTEIPLVESSEHQIGYLIVSHDGQNEKIFADDGDLFIPNKDVSEVWIDRENKVHYQEPAENKQTLRLYVDIQDKDPQTMTAWVWGEGFDDSMLGLDFDKDRLKISGIKDNFVYFDFFLDESADETASLGFLLHDGVSQTSDYQYKISELGNTIYTRWEGESMIYDNPFFTGSRLRSARWLNKTTIQVSFDTVPTDLGAIKLINGDNEIAYALEEKDSTIFLTIKENDFHSGGVWSIMYEDQSVQIPLSWEIKDSLYATDTNLGLTWQNNKPSLRFWSPSADGVKIHVYDQSEQRLFVETMGYDEQEKVWVWHSEQTDLKNKYYQLEIIRSGESVFVLDPYAKSLAPWNRFALDSNCNSSQASCIAKAAFVNPSDADIALDYAQIDHYQGRQDAIIYETHVRDFTSDINIEAELESPFGTFTAFIEKLDYLQDLGVTHIQLLPIMSYYFIDETVREMRTLDPTVQGKDSNYNWGYDPHSYFSISGFYSANPSDPSARILEFKQLVNAIHERGMGVILDVVFNHTAQVGIFEDLEPEYYHFMDDKNNAKTSFGGGRLGTTHYMSSKLLIDAIEYWTEEFKVDGFRFDMMGDHDAETIQKAYDRAAELNPKTLFLGEGWRTYEGDDNDPRQAADQDWMGDTSDVGVFSDEYRNIMKSGFPNEGTAQFLTGGTQNIKQLFDNIKAQPSNILNDEPQDIVQYLEAHDNLTLHDVIAVSIKKSPQTHQAEILQRQRLGNLMLFASQGTIFMHSGQEYGRTRQVFAEDEKASQMDKLHTLYDEQGQMIEYPYFIADAYNSSDAINHFDWEKVNNHKLYPEHVKTYEYTKGLIALRKQNDVFRMNSLEEINEKIELLEAKEIEAQDLAMAYRLNDKETDYYVIINADETARSFSFSQEIIAALNKGIVLADQNQVNAQGIENVSGLNINDDHLSLEPLTATIIKVEPEQAIVEEEKPKEDIEQDQDQETEDNQSNNQKEDKQDTDNQESDWADKPGKLPETGKTSLRNFAFMLMVLGVVILRFNKKE